MQRASLPTSAIFPGPTRLGGITRNYTFGTGNLKI